jgi:hypothetical protein
VIAARRLDFRRRPSGLGDGGRVGRLDWLAGRSTPGCLTSAEPKSTGWRRADRWPTDRRPDDKHRHTPQIAHNEHS